MARQRWRAYYGGGAMSSSASCPSFVLLITPRFSPACTGSVAVAALPVHDRISALWLSGDLDLYDGSLASRLFGSL